VNNGVAHCSNPRVGGAVQFITGDPKPAEMQIHFIRFTKEFCGLDGDWYEPKPTLYEEGRDRLD
jgi:hypothetical protein